MSLWLIHHWEPFLLLLWIRLVAPVCGHFLAVLRPQLRLAAHALAETGGDLSHLERVVVVRGGDDDGSCQSLGVLRLEDARAAASGEQAKSVVDSV